MHFGMSQAQLIAHPTFVTRVSQLKICDFSGEAFKGLEVL
jgi:hypothetical protein